MGKITFDNKVDSSIISAPEINKLTAENINQIKESVNELYDITHDGSLRPVGALEFTDNVTQTVITVIDEYVNFQIDSTAGLLSQFERPSNCTLKYIGETPTKFLIISSLSAEALSNNQTFEFAYFVNNVQRGVSVFNEFRFGGIIQSITLNKVFELSNNDEICLKVRNKTSTGNILISSLSMTIT